MSYKTSYAKITPYSLEYNDEDEEYDEDFITYPEECVFCYGETIELSDDGNITQTCGSCGKTFHAPDYYEIKDKKLVRRGNIIHETREKM
jgi:ribosomal protein S27AE